MRQQSRARRETPGWGWRPSEEPSRLHSLCRRENEQGWSTEEVGEGRAEGPRMSPKKLWHQKP